MCALTTILLLYPGSELDSLWRLNPDARMAFQSLGSWSIALMLGVGTVCAFAAVGLWKGRVWGKRLAIITLSANIAGDLINAFVRSDYRALIGLPIGGFMIFYLIRANSRSRQS